MATTGLVNIGGLATGILATPRLEAEAILVEDGRIAAIGATSRTGARGADVVVDTDRDRDATAVVAAAPIPTLSE